LGRQFKGFSLSRKTNQPVNTRFGRLLAAEMKQRRISIRDLAAKLEITYEHMRRLARGEGLPSDYLLQLIATELGRTYEELEMLSTSDKIEKRYGTASMKLDGHYPSLEPIEKYWPSLTAQQKSEVTDMVFVMYGRNKSRKIIS
jgi:transcriptional regulator with XRE-family HTH domain